MKSKNKTETSHLWCVNLPIHSFPRCTWVECSILTDFPRWKLGVSTWDPIYNYFTNTTCVYGVPGQPQVSHAFATNDVNNSPIGETPFFLKYREHPNLPHIQDILGCQRIDKVNA